MCRKTSFEEYIQAANNNEVGGWCAPTSFQFAQVLMNYQTKNNIFGSICEIGVFQGKYFIALALQRQENEFALGYDVFEDTELSTDNYGGRSVENIFRANVKKYLGDDDSVIIERKDSMQLTPKDIMENAGGRRFRFFSVDGSHSVQHTVNDMCLAQDVLLPGGIIAVDDITNSDWPGVMEGVNRFFYFTPAIKVAPFAIIANKLYLTTHSHHDRYYEYVSSLGALYVKKSVMMWGCKAFSLKPKR